MEKGSHCGNEGLQHIGEKDCKQAAERRGLDFYTESDKSYLQGCYKHSNSVYYNTYNNYNGYVADHRSAPICRLIM